MEEIQSIYKVTRLFIVSVVNFYLSGTRKLLHLLVREIISYVVILYTCTCVHVCIMFIVYAKKYM